MGVPGTAEMWWPARRVIPLTSDESHSLQLWIIFIRHEYCDQKSVDDLPCNANIGLSWKWVRILIGCSSFQILIFALGIRGGDGRYGVLNTSKTWKTTRIIIDRTILACLN